MTFPLYLDDTVFIVLDHLRCVLADQSLGLGRGLLGDLLARHPEDETMAPSLTEMSWLEEMYHPHHPGLAKVFRRLIGVRVLVRGNHQLVEVVELHLEDRLILVIREPLLGLAYEITSNLQSHLRKESVTIYSFIISNPM